MRPCSVRTKHQPLSRRSQHLQILHLLALCNLNDAVVHCRLVVIPGGLGHGSDSQHHLLQTVALVVDARHDAGDDVPLPLRVSGGSGRQVEDRRRGVSTTGKGDYSGGYGRGNRVGREGSDDAGRSRKRRRGRGDGRGRGKRDWGRGKRDDGCIEECVKRRGRGDGRNTYAAVQPHGVVAVPLPAPLADAVVDGDVDGGGELQRKRVGRGQRVAFVAPAVAPHTAAMDRALCVWRWHVVNTRQQTKLTAEVEAEQENSWVWV